jgi:hypothetical protein
MIYCHLKTFLISDEKMLPILHIIGSYLPDKSVLPLVSKEWKYVIHKNNRDILNGLVAKYPASSIYGSIIKAIKIGDINMVRSIATEYQGYLPVRWEYIAKRMIYTDIPYGDKNIETIASIICNKIDHDYNDISLSIFVIKFDLSKGNRCNISISTDEYQRYINYSPNLPIDNITFLNPKNIYDLLRLGRIDVVDDLYQRYPNEMKDILQMYTSCVFRKHVMQWLDVFVTHTLHFTDISSRVRWALTDDPSGLEELPDDIIHSDSINVLEHFIDSTECLSSIIHPSYIDITNVNHHIVAKLFSNKEYIQDSIDIIDIDELSDPEYMNLVLYGIGSKEDEYFWHYLISAAMEGNIEVVNKYVKSQQDSKILEYYDKYNPMIKTYINGIFDMK